MTMQEIFDRCSVGQFPFVKWTGALSKRAVSKEHLGQIISVTVKPEYKGIAVGFEDADYDLHFYADPVPGKKHMKDLTFV